MYSPPQLLIKYLRYFVNASNSNGHGIHSPFVFNLIKTVLNDPDTYAAYDLVEKERKILLGDPSPLAVTDFGAGSQKLKDSTRKVNDIARHSLKSPKYARLLFRLARHFNPETIVELGTSLGITTAYLSLACPGANIFTFEGSSAIALKASSLFKKLNLSNIKQVTGNFDSTLQAALPEIGRADFVFIDGNHRYEPTVKYFNELRLACHEYSVMVFDDIHWSAEMEKAWHECRTDPSVTMSLDLFFIGLLFFRTEFRVPQHFTIRF
jgi:predicted O-methyltransferase YrrM